MDGTTKPTYNPVAVNAVVIAMNKHGITNPFVQTGILGTIGKETGFRLRPEEGYGKTSNARIRTIFGARVSDLSESALTALKANDVAFFEKVYGYQTKIGKQLGNTKYGDGYKFRGRSFNGVTGRGQYKSYGDQIGIDLLSNPDRLNEIPIAAEVSVMYYVNNFRIGENNGYVQKTVGVPKANDVKSVADGIRLAVQATAGWKTDLSSTFMLENLQRAIIAADTIMKEAASYTLTSVKKNPGTTIAILFFLGAGVAAYVYREPLKRIVINLFKK